MNFCLLLDEDQVRDARQRFPLFYDVCLPTLPDHGQGLRHAVVCDADNTVLAVLQHAHPFRSVPVSVVTMVANQMSGIHRLLRFLNRFLREVQGLDVPLITISHHLVHCLQGDVTIAGVEAAFLQHRFRLNAGGTPPKK